MRVPVNILVESLLRERTCLEKVNGEIPYMAMLSINSQIKWTRFGGMLILNIVVLTLVSCRQAEIGRASIKHPGEYELYLEHHGGEIEIWTDFDVEYVGDPLAWYDIVIFAYEKEITEVRCDPFNVKNKLMARSVVAEGKNKLSYLALMDCSLELPAGDYRAQVTLSVEGEGLKIFWADIIFK